MVPYVNGNLKTGLYILQNTMVLLKKMKNEAVRNKMKRREKGKGN